MAIPPLSYRELPKTEHWNHMFEVTKHYQHWNLIFEEAYYLDYFDLYKYSLSEHKNPQRASTCARFVEQWPIMVGSLAAHGLVLIVI